MNSETEPSYGHFYQNLPNFELLPWQQNKNAEYLNIEIGEKLSLNLSVTRLPSFRPEVSKIFKL